MAKVVRAPELARPGLAWFNVAKPLSLADLAGRLVILDFWTFCCINCMHIIPTLKRVEQAFPEELVVIGVHSPKFAAERDPANLSAALARYGIEHPVIHDPDHVLWREYAVRAWPTLSFISPDGYVIGQVSGEPDADRLFEVVSQTIAEGQSAGTLRPASLGLASTPEIATPGRLRFPGKIKPLAAGGGWVLADAGHHQIVLLEGAGREQRRFGDGSPGFRDGPGTKAAFRDPQGLIAAPGVIYVADTGNHAVRRIALDSGQVTTVAGTGKRGRILSAPVAAKDSALASPWDLALDGERLMIANAGTHQLAVLDLARGTVARLAGSGAEAIGDGPTAEATLAQPSGLALSRDRAKLYFADSETSAIRVLDFTTNSVRTLVGTGLFTFGHRNGALAEALFQHPLGLAVLDENRIAVADSYNNALRVIDLPSGTVADLDEGYTCADPLCLPLAEPAGLAADGRGGWLVADTNNHRILIYDAAQRAYRTWFQ